MNHADAQKLLGDHLEGALAAEECARVDAHLAECTECAEEVAELREVVGLLRSLPDPEPPPWLAARVMARIEDGEARPSLLVRVAGFLASPSFAAPVAAGFVSVLLLSTVLEVRPGHPGGDPTGPSQVVQARAANTGAVAGGRTELARRPPVRVQPPATPPLPAPSLALTFPRFGPVPRVESARGARAAFLGTAVLDPPRGQLDAELDRLQLDPFVFLDGVRGADVTALEQRLEPLIAHAADRGNALDVAQRLRGVRHPEASRVAEYFELAALQR